MSFYGRSFLYAGIPSELYGLYIASIDSDAINNSMASSAMEIREEKIFRKPTPYLFGMTPSPKLEFDFSAYSEGEIDATAFEKISRWLFSSRDYLPFEIDQWDMQGNIFYAILQDPEIVRVGNIIQGFSCKVLCNSPFAYKYPKTTAYTYSSTVVDSTEVYLNESDDSDDYLYPTALNITMNNVDGNISITNLDDNSRVVSFSNLLANEVLTINPTLQTITSSTGLKRLSHSNKKFLRLSPGQNRLRIQGNVASVSMTNTWVARKIGG